VSTAESTIIATLRLIRKPHLTALPRSSQACNINQTNRSSPLFARGYAAMGKAIGDSGRNMSYSCSWPAALGNNETEKPFDTMIADGCNLWRNWHDIGCGWSSVSSIVDHWGDYGPSLVASGGLHGDPGAPGGGHYHDMCAPLLRTGCCAAVNSIALNLSLATAPHHV
jgi:hypothetical protein